ncbi:BREX system Lon protease-like protein BrxL [Vulcanococcus sp.]|uniref:BREX system Lon protease-like protein BrxL n=1 Tax=Vulcanococcus sp. TaxID=2856995 RepID=UPI003F69B440
MHTAHLACQYDAAYFDEVGGASFDRKDGVDILKGSLASGEFSRRKESIRRGRNSSPG